ncbi:hypothetical protein THAOC_08021, partial [Thalassiosira oceanica]
MKAKEPAVNYLDRARSCGPWELYLNSNTPSKPGAARELFLQEGARDCISQPTLAPPHPAAFAKRQTLVCGPEAFLAAFLADFIAHCAETRAKDFKQEAIWHLCNEFPLVGSTAIESMFCSSRYSYIKARLALESLRIDPKCSPFLPSARPQIQFVITDTRLLLETCSLQQGSSNLTVRVHQAIKRLQALLGKLTVQCPRECERHGFRLFDIEKLESFFHSMLLRQMQLDEIGADAACDVAYHHTSSSNIESINRHGLLPRDEHQSKGIMPANKHGVTFGTGIYTCEKPK